MDSLIPQLRHYRINHSEPRFFRHRDRLRWEIDKGWPTHMGLTFPERIRMKHYKYRTPEQIQRRLDTRRDNRRRGFPGWDHAKSLDWRTTLALTSSVHFDSGDGNYVIDRERVPDHLGSRLSRFIKRVMHGIGVWP